MEMAYPALVSWRYLHLFVAGVEVGLSLEFECRTPGGLPYHIHIHSYGLRECALLLLEEEEPCCWVPRIPGMRCVGELVGAPTVWTDWAWAQLRRVSSSHEYLRWFSLHHHEHHHWGVQSSFSLCRSGKIIE